MGKLMADDYPYNGILLLAFQKHTLKHIQAVQIQVCHGFVKNDQSGIENQGP